MLIISCIVNHTNYIDQLRLYVCRDCIKGVSMALQLSIINLKIQTSEQYKPGKTISDSCPLKTWWDQTLLIFNLYIIGFVLHIFLLITKFHANRLAMRLYHILLFQNGISVEFVNNCLYEEWVKFFNFSYSLMPSGQQLFRRFPCQLIHPLPSMWADR